MWQSLMPRSASVRPSVWCSCFIPQRRIPWGGGGSKSIVKNLSMLSAPILIATPLPLYKKTGTMPHTGRHAHMHMQTHTHIRLQTRASNTHDLFIFLACKPQHAAAATKHSTSDRHSTITATLIHQQHSQFGGTFFT